MTSTTRRMFGCVAIAMGMGAVYAAGIGDAIADARTSRRMAAQTEFITDAEIYEGTYDGSARAERAMIRQARWKSGGRVGGTIVVPLVVKNADRPIACQFVIASSDGSYWDYTYDARIFNPNNSQVAFGTRWVNNKPSFLGGLGTTLVEPFPTGTYRCVVEWWASSDDTGANVTLPPVQVSMNVLP